MTIKYGIEGKLYYCIAGIGGTPTWVECISLKDVTLNVDGKDVDLTTRGNGGFAANGVGLFEASIEGSMPMDQAATDYIALETAFFAKSVLGIAVMSGGITVAASRGLWADCQITKFAREENAEGVQEIKLTFKPTKSASAPSWHVITGS